MKKIIIGVIVFVFIVALVITIPYIFKIQGEVSDSSWSSTDTYSIENVPSLQMKDNADFKILILSDLQLNILTPGKNKKALDLAGLLIEEQSPDLVITTGDNVSFIYQGILVKQFVEKMESLNFPWAVTLGNHDSEASVDRNWHGNMYKNAENCLFQNGPSEIDGVGNYQINILNSAGNIVKSLILLDSHSKTKYETGRDYDYIHQNQLDWYKWVTEGMEKSNGSKVLSLMFFHIPLIEFDEAINDSDTEILFGEQNEGVYSAPVSSGLFELMLEQGSTTHIFNGHDHINNLSVLYKGIQMTYGTKTGPTSYYNSDIQGGTLITIKDDTYEVLVEHLYH